MVRKGRFSMESNSLGRFPDKGPAVARIPTPSQVPSPQGHPFGLRPGRSLPGTLPVGCLVGTERRCDDAWRATDCRLVLTRLPCRRP